MDKSEVEKITKILKAASSVSQLELPALLVAVLALIPGVLDETIVGIGAVTIFAVIALGRRYLINNREEYRISLDQAFSENKLTELEYKSAVKDLNTLTVEGGKKS